MLYSPLQERVRRSGPEQLLLLAVERCHDRGVSEAIGHELDLRATTARCAPDRHNDEARPSLLRWLDPQTRPAAPHRVRAG